jgi:YbgC/YbaW family acyl-CoA thioester hydrolase
MGTDMDAASQEFQLAREVEWGDCDGAGIIYYPTYFRWIDAATWAILRAVGFHANRMRAEGRALPVVATECQFLMPARHGDQCEVRSRVEHFGVKSFVLSHAIVRNDGAVLAKGTERRVWARYESEAGSALKGEAITASLKTALAGGTRKNKDAGH